MKTIKIIDLLIGKETPKKFKYDEEIFKRQTNGGYVDKEGDNLTEWIFSDYSNIYDEVEIIGEDKEIEKIKIEYSPDIEEKIFYENGYKPNHCILGDAGTGLLIKKINELIDKVNSLENNQ